jgi:hypothetical protein
MAHNISKFLVLFRDKVESAFSFGGSIALQIGGISRVVSAGVSNTPDPLHLAPKHLAQLGTLQVDALEGNL